MKAYHISPKKHRKSILKFGIRPTLGPRSKRFGEVEPKTYLTSHIEDSIKLTKKRIFSSHPDFITGIDIWEVKLPEKIELIRDKRFSEGFFIKNYSIETLDIDLVKSLEWMDK